MSSSAQKTDPGALDACATPGAPLGGEVSDGADLGEFAAVNEGRARSYGLLARLFHKEVDQALLDELRTVRFPAATGNDRCDEGNRLMAAYLSGVWGGTLQELAVDYVRCFIGSGSDAFSAAYPYESVYTSPRRLMMQEARDEVLASYRAQGYERAADWKEPEDHVAAELEFMGALAERTAQACRAGDEPEVVRLLQAQRVFLADHLYAWTGMLTADMRAFAGTDFYRALADQLDGLLQNDRELLAAVLGVGDVAEDAR